MKKPSIWKTVLIVILFAGLMNTFVRMIIPTSQAPRYYPTEKKTKEKDAEQTETTRLKTERDSTDNAQKAAKPKREHDWWYDATEDRMTSDSTYTANIVSLNQLVTAPVWEPGSTSVSETQTTTARRKIFSDKRYPVTNSTTTTTTAPPREVTHLEDVCLRIRKNSDGTIEVLLKTYGHGAFAGLYNGVRVRFDKRKATHYSTVGAAGGNTNTIFIEPAGSFVKELKNSTRLLIEVAVEGRGTQLFEFETENLQWNH